MDLLRKLLFPFAIVYGLVSAIRNWLYDRKILKSSTFEIPVIAVGNLSVGGTGKSPQVEYLIRLLSPKHKIAVLSRGYKRSTKGFVLAGGSASAENLGDEPYQFHRKFPEITVAVDADRANGIKQLIALMNPDVILLDDAFQHRKVQAGFYILLTAYNDLFSDDFILPMGNLRESRDGADRADCIIVTKCPKTLSAAEMKQIRNKIKPNTNQELFFTFIDYEDFVVNETEKIAVSTLRQEKKLLVAGIAKPKPFFNHLRHDGDMVMEFPDHHAFTDSEIETIKSKAHKHKIVTTEKDYVRLGRQIPNLFYLPIRSTFLSGGEKFNQIILDYVGKNTTDN